MITESRLIYKPLEYPKAEEYFITQEQAHWLWTEVNMNNDKNDWKENLSDSEKKLISYILKGFTQTELLVEEYWSSKVSKWFPKPEILMMSSSFANMEAIHTKSYSYLNDTLDLFDYEGFLHEPEIKTRLDRLINIDTNDTLDNKALSLAIFSAFTEGVTLYSSFIILLNFSRRNLLKGVSQIIQFSIKDETLHSEAGCWLFKTLISENSWILTNEFKEKVYEAARLTYEMEEKFIDKAFEQDEIASLKKDSLKEYMKARTNEKLKELGLNEIYKNLDNEKLKELDWFNVFIYGNTKADFFAARENNYTKGGMNWDDI